MVTPEPSSETRSQRRFPAWIIVLATVVPTVIVCGIVATVVLIYLNAGTPRTAQADGTAVEHGTVGREPPTTVRTKTTEPVESALPTRAAAPTKPTSPPTPPVQADRDPWKEAAAVFAKLVEGEPKRTAAKLNDMDYGSRNAAELKIDHVKRFGLDQSPEFGRDLWRVGLTDFVTSQATKTLDDQTFRAVMAKLNPNATTTDIVAVAVEYTLTEQVMRSTVAKMIVDGQDTRIIAEYNRVRQRWTVRQK